MGLFRQSRKPRSSFRQWLEAIFIAVVLLLLVRNFAFQWYIVHGTSMEKTLLPGDFLVVNKLTYGARFPITPIAVPFTDLYLNQQLPYWRMPGTSQLTYNDILVLNDPYQNYLPLDRRIAYVKRLAGMPGDTVLINKKALIINGVMLPTPSTACFNYKITLKSNADAAMLFSKWQITEGGKVKDGWVVSTTADVAHTLQLQPEITSVTLLKDQSNTYHGDVFPFHQNYTWNTDQFGPIIVPKAGSTIKLTPSTLPMHQSTIEHEGHQVTIEGETILVDGIEQTTYTFSLDHFFVLGDNRHNSVDSRYWGFVPENHIVGKASFILFSIDKSNGTSIRWKRTFHNIK